MTVTPPQKESALVWAIKALTLTCAVVIFTWPLTGIGAIIAAALATLLGAVLARILDARRIRLLAGMTIGIGIALSGSWIGDWSRSLTWFMANLSARHTLIVADCLTFGLFCLGSTFALRLLTIRRYSLAVLETAVVVCAVAQVFARHRNLSLDRPLFMADWALTNGIDPQLVLQGIGIAAAVVAILMSLRSQTPIKLTITLVALLLLAIGVYQLTENVQLHQELAGLAEKDGKSKNPAQQLESDGSSNSSGGGSGGGSGTGDGQSQNNQQPPLPVAVALLHSDFTPENNLLYFRQQVLSKFDGKRLVADPSTAFDKDVIRDFPYRQVHKAERGGSDAHHKRMPTSMFLMADHPQPVALSASIEVTPRPNPSPRRFVAAYDVISLVPSIPIHRLVGRSSIPDSWKKAQRDHFLKHPDDPRYAALAEEIAQEVDLRFSGDDIVKALAIKDYLEKEGFYTRSERHAGVDDPAASFLFGNLKGYCVHFAHAAVHLLRSQGIAARVAVGYAVDNRMRGSGSAVIIMGDRAHAWPEIHVAGVGWITFDIYPQQSDEPPPQVVAQSLESLLGEIARDDPTGGRSADPDANAFAIPWKTIGSWLALLFGFLLALAYAIKVSRLTLPLLRPESHRLAFVAVLDGLSNVGFVRRYGETREGHAHRMQNMCPSFEELTHAHLRLTLGYTRETDKDTLRRLCSQVRQEMKTNLSFTQKLMGLINPWGWWFTR